MAPLLDGVRGDAAMDVKAFAQIAVSVGRLMMSAGSSIASLDLNPVMVGAVGEGAVVVDALLERGGLSWVLPLIAQSICNGYSASVVRVRRA
jgi:hypothetical protein